VVVVAPVRYVPRWLARGRYRAFAGIPQHDTWGGVRVTYPRYAVVPRVGRALHGFGVFICTLRAHLRARRRSKPDVVLSYFAYPYGFAAVLTAALFRIPAVVSCRGSDINLLAKPWLHRLLIAFALKRCARVLAVSNALAKEIAAMGICRDRVRVVSNGIDRAAFRGMTKDRARRTLGLTVDGPLVVCVSRLSPEKGIDVLVDASVILRSVRRSLRVVVVGDGVSAAPLARRCQEQDVETVVQFAGRRPHEEVSRWMSAADVVALPSRSEGYPNVVLEALACGRPVVASRVGGVPEIIEDGTNGLCVPPSDAGALASALLLAMERQWDEDRLREFAKRTWDDVADDLIEVIREIRGDS